MGTPILQLYYNNKLLKLRFVSNKQKKPAAPQQGAAANNDANNKATNVYIGQLHNFAIQSLVNITLNSIKVRLILHYCT